MSYSRLNLRSRSHVLWKTSQEPFGKDNDPDCVQKDPGLHLKEDHLQADG